MLDYDIVISPKKVYRKVMEFMDTFKEEIKYGENNANRYYADVIKKMSGTYFWNVDCASDRVCMHTYSRGIKKGQICGNKIFITTDNRLQKFLCSRHCRDYVTKGRTYSDRHKRCNHIRANGEQCKHKCSSNATYCYIHVTKKAIHGPDEALYNDAINKLKKKRKLYFKLKKFNKFSKIVKFLKISNDLNLLENSNHLDNKIITKNANFCNNLKLIEIT